LTEISFWNETLDSAKIANHIFALDLNNPRLISSYDFSSFNPKDISFKERDLVQTNHGASGYYINTFPQPRKILQKGDFFNHSALFKPSLHISRDIDFSITRLINGDTTEVYNDSTAKSILKYQTTFFDDSVVIDLQGNYDSIYINSSFYSFNDTIYFLSFRDSNVTLRLTAYKDSIQCLQNIYLYDGCIECDSAQIGDQFVLSGDTFIVVDRPMLDSMVRDGHDVTKACVSHINDMSFVFRNQTAFNQDIGLWDVSNVTTMEGMFNTTQSFNQDLSKWDVSSVINMKGVFKGAKSFNSDISSWDVSAVNNMSSLFFNAETFNQDISAWDVSSVQKMTSMFFRADSFNQDINVWDVSGVTLMSRMFKEAASFNKPLSSWQVENVTRMSEMFKDAAVFDQDLSSWCVKFFQYNPPVSFADNSPLQTQHYPLWGELCQQL